MTTNNLPVELSGLTEAERQEALKILGEYSTDGFSETYNKLLQENYSELPVDIMTFVENRAYLGNAWHVGTKFNLYPFWQEKLKELFPDPFTTNYNDAIFSGSRGQGKSEISVTIMLYMMYRVMCLKNPHKFFNLKPTEKIAFAFMNITKILSEEIGISKFQNTVQLSPWFMQRGTLTRRNNEDYWNPPDYINIIIGSQASHVIGQPIYAAFFDEISFIRNQDIEKQKRIAIDMIDTAIGGMKTRFLQEGQNPTLLILASSARSEKSFLEEHMKKKLADDEAKALIINEAVWNVKPPSTYSGNRFYVGVGNKFLTSEIIPEGDDTSIWRNKGYQILSVPVEFKEEFKDNIDRALCDYAGISSSELQKYISGPRLAMCKEESLQNLFTRDVIEVGNSPSDLTQYYDFIDLSRIPKEMQSMPLYVHLDMSISGDMTGISGVWIKGKKPGLNSDNKEMYYQLAFNVSIKAPKGYQISFAKNREFIYWLKNVAHFAVKGVSTDTFQNASLGQDLSAKGYNYEIISVDRVNTAKVCEPYAYLKNCIYEQRVAMYDAALLTEELLNLERNGSSGKIDHPDGGKSGCFTGDTKVSLCDGRELTLLELVEEFSEGKRNFVYSFNESTKIIEPKLIERAWKTKSNAELVEVTLDNGETLRCTPDHRFMLRTGEYCEAQNLKEGVSLMPLYRKFSSKASEMNSYRLYYEPIEDSWHYEHRKFAKEVLDEKYLVHHKDCNKTNNNPTNLIWCSKTRHQQIHAELQTGAHTYEAQKKRSAAVKKWHEENKNTVAYSERSRKLHEANLAQHGRTEEDYLKHQAIIEQQHLNGIRLKNQAENRKIQHQVYISSIEKMFNVSWNDLSNAEKDSLAVKYVRQMDPSIQERISKGLQEAHSKGHFERAYIALGKCNLESKKLKELCPTIDKEKFFLIFGVDYDSIEPKRRAPWVTKYRRIVCKQILNHKVVSVRKLSEVEDVYDLTVADNHNFALSAGVFVHNSKDVADAFCGALWNASQHADEFAFEYGELLEAGIEASSIITNEAQKKQQIQVDMEDILKELHDPLNQYAKDNSQKDNFMDFGMGKAQTVDYVAPFYFSQGIIL